MHVRKLLLIEARQKGWFRVNFGALWIHGPGNPLQAARAGRDLPGFGAFPATHGLSHHSNRPFDRKFQVNEQIGMTAASFLSDFSRRMSCTTNVLHARELDHAGQRQAVGSVCTDCPGCDTKSGDMGLAQSGYLVERNLGQFSLAWSCSSCGTTVHEDTTPLTCFNDAKTVSADPICFSCRKLSANTT